MNGSGRRLTFWQRETAFRHRGWLAAQGLILPASEQQTPEGFAAYLKAEMNKWGAVIRELSLSCGVDERHCGVHAVDHVTSHQDVHDGGIVVLQEDTLDILYN